MLLIDRDKLNPAWRAIGAKKRKVKPAQSAPQSPIEWERADPAALASFDPATKTCDMNCGPHGLDPRSRKERLFLCDLC